MIVFVAQAARASQSANVAIVAGHISVHVCNHVSTSIAAEREDDVFVMRECQLLSRQRLLPLAGNDGAVLGAVVTVVDVLAVLLLLLLLTMMVILLQMIASRSHCPVAVAMHMSCPGRFA